MASLSLSLPKGWKILGELKCNPAVESGDVREALIHVLKNPVGCKPFGPANLSDKKILIAVDDITRPTPTSLFFGALLEYLLSCGAKKENISVIAALGIHRAMTRREMEDKIGRGNLEGIKWFNHDCSDEAGHVRLGVTKRGTKVILNKRLTGADLIICAGLIEPHPLLGFGGGLKMIVPGLAHKETIAQNHMQGVSPKRFNYVGVCESPMRLDLEEAALMLCKEIFIVNAVLNQDLKIHRFFCGGPVSAHREGAKAAESICKKEIAELADCAITFSDPMNADLRQALKCIANVEQSVKDNGIILGFLKCENGIGDIPLAGRRAFFNYGLNHFILRILGAGNMFWLAKKAVGIAAVEERFLAHFSMRMAARHRIFIYSDRLAPGTGRRSGLFRQFGDKDEMLKEARRLLPKEAKVYIWPHGGATYAFR